MDSDQGKLFIGGIAWETNEDKLNEYFSQYGEVSNVVVMRDKLTGRPRGFGFVVFADPSVLDRVLQDKHTIDGRTVEAKRALSREDQQTSGKSGNSAARSAGGGAGSNVRTKKIFVGGLPPTLSEDGFRQYFQSYGNVTDVVVMYDQNTQRPRGFGFISFDSEEAVDNVLHKTFHELNGKLVEVKRALPKDSNPSSGGGRSMGAGGSYQSYGGSTGNGSSYDGRMDANRYTQQPQAGGNGYPSYGSSGYGAPGYGYGAPNSNVGYGGYGGYGNVSSGYSGPSGPYGNPNVPNAGYVSAPGSQRNPWGNQTPSGYSSAGYGGGSTGYGSASSWNAPVGSGGSGAAPTGQSPGGATGYGNQGYGYGGYGGSEGPYGSQGNYGSLAGRGSGGPVNPTEGTGDQGAGSGYVGGGYGDAWRSDTSQGGPYGNSQVNAPPGGPVGYGGGYGGPHGRQAQQQ